MKLFLDKFFHKNIFSWDCLGNLILKKHLKTKFKSNFFKIDGEKIKALPERNFTKYSNNPLSLQDNYIDFYFENEYSEYALENTGGIILLHNSWTPLKYKKLGKKEFLNENNTLSNIFKKIL